MGKYRPMACQNSFWGVPNRGSEPPKSSLGPPKSSPEPSKTTFLKDIELKKAQEGPRQSFSKPKWPTWFQVGGPRPSKIEAKPEKIDVKNNTFSTSIFKGFGLRFRRIFWWFLEGNAELISNCESKLRTLKIVILPRKNAYF